MHLDISTRQVSDDTAVVVIAGQLTLGTSLKVADTNLQSLVARGVTKLVLDLSGVPFIDSAGLGALIHTYGLTQEKNGALRLCGVQPRIANMLKMTRTDLIIPVDADAEVSIAAIQ